MVKENQSNPETENRKVPMIVTKEVIRDFELNPGDVTWKLIGKRKFQVVMVDANDAIYKACMDPVWAEIKREERDSRCLIRGKRGKLIRCPDSRRCRECEYYSEVCKETNRTASLSYMVEAGKEPVAEGSFEDEIIYKSILDELIEKLEEIEPGYGRVFRMLYNGDEQQEIAESLHADEDEVSNRIEKIREIAQSLSKDIF